MGYWPAMTRQKRQAWQPRHVCCCERWEARKSGRCWERDGIRHFVLCMRLGWWTAWAGLRRSSAEHVQKIVVVVRNYAFQERQRDTIVGPERRHDSTSGRGWSGGRDPRLQWHCCPYVLQLGRRNVIESRCPAAFRARHVPLEPFCRLQKWPRARQPARWRTSAGWKEGTRLCGDPPPSAGPLFKLHQSPLFKLHQSGRALFSKGGMCSREAATHCGLSAPGCLHTHRIDFRSHHANCTCYGSVTSQLTSQLTTSWYRRHKSDACLTPPWALRAPRLYVYVLCQASRDLRDEPSPPRAPALRDQSRAVHRRSLHASLAPAPEDGYAEQRSRSLSASWEALLASSIRTASLN